MSAELGDGWTWIGANVVHAVHEEQLREHGGASGIRDASLLASALAKPQQIASYTDADAHTLAAAYAFGISKNHPFIDGNKRTAWVVARLFLLLHGLDRSATDEESYLAMLKLASGLCTQEEFTDWLRANTVRVGEVRS